MMATANNSPVEGLMKKLADKFGSSVEFGEAGGLRTVVVEKGRAHELLVYLKTGKDFPSVMLTDLFPVDCQNRDPRFDIIYLLNSLDMKVRIVVKARVADGEALPTVSDIFGIANWLEREAYDMFGLRFEGHPNLTRILTADDFDGYPLRKDFPTQGYGFDTPFTVNLEKE
jgi:NADH-quinone oxidoreductase subunit C